MTKMEILNEMKGLIVMDNLYSRNNISDVLIDMSKNMSEDAFVKWAESFISGFLKQEENVIKQKEEYEIQRSLLKKHEEEQKKLEAEQRNKDNYKETIEFRNGWKIINRTPIMSENEREEKKKAMLMEMYKLLVKEV